MITLAITSTEIKLMEAINGKVTKWASAPLETGVFQEEVVLNPKALAAAARQLMSVNRIREKNVTISVGSLYSLSRIVMLPTQPEQSVSERAILDAAQEVMPLAMDEMYLSWQLISSYPGGQRALIIGVPREVIDSEIKALRAAGINPHTLELRTLSLARTAGRKDAIVFNIDSTSFDIVVVADGITEVLRTSAWQPAGLSAEDKAQQIISALNLTANYYNSHNPDSPLPASTPLFITGEMSGDTTLIGNMKNEIEYPIEPLTPPLGYPEHMPVSQYAVNFGLALRRSSDHRGPAIFARKKKEESGNKGYVSSMPGINMLPKAYQAWRPSPKQVYASLAIIAALVPLFPAYSSTVSAIQDTSIVRQRYTSINAKMDKRLAELAGRQPMQQAVVQYNSIVNAGGNFIDDLEAIRTLAEKDTVQIQAISQSQTGISFACEAVDYYAFRGFVTDLEHTGRFTTPIIPPEGYPYIRGGNVRLSPAASK